MYDAVFEVPAGMALDSKSSAPNDPLAPWVRYEAFRVLMASTSDEALGQRMKAEIAQFDDSLLGRHVRAIYHSLTPSQIDAHTRLGQRLTTKATASIDATPNPFWASLSTAQRLLVSVRRGLLTSQKANQDLNLKRQLQEEFLALLLHRRGQVLADELAPP